MRPESAQFRILQSSAAHLQNHPLFLRAAPSLVLNGIRQVDTFLRDNLDWMGRASNWAKFTATASIGVVHRGHTKESMSLLQPYLPQGGVSALPYSEGGALYALGLIHSNKGADGNAEVRVHCGSVQRFVDCFVLIFVQPTVVVWLCSFGRRSGGVLML